MDDSNKKKAIFMGGKSIGWKCLEALCLHRRIEVSLIISNTSDLYDGADRWYPKIHELAKLHNIPYVATDKPNTGTMVTTVKSISPDYIFVVYYDAILKPELFTLARYGAINLHLADAEKYRGCYPTVFAIMNGEMEYGVTLHYIDEGTDTGAIIEKAAFNLSSDYTGKDLYEKATDEGYRLFMKNLDAIVSGTAMPYSQKATSATMFYRRSQFPAHQIEFKGTAEDVYNRIRALIFPPFKMPFFYIGKKKYTIVETDD